MKVASTDPPFQVIGVGLVFDGYGRVLIDQRLEQGLLGGMWEFPGGKQEPGEAIADTIARELREELAIEVSAIASSFTCAATWPAIPSRPCSSR